MTPCFYHEWGGLANAANRENEKVFPTRWRGRLTLSTIKWYALANGGGIVIEPVISKPGTALSPYGNPVSSGHLRRDVEGSCQLATRTGVQRADYVPADPLGAERAHGDGKGMVRWHVVGPDRYRLVLHDATYGESWDTGIHRAWWRLGGGNSTGSRCVIIEPVIGKEWIGMCGLETNGNPVGTFQLIRNVIRRRE
jgi:hypothetical protein